MSALRVANRQRLWRCDVCGTVDTWGPTWSWYGSLGMRTHPYSEPNVERVVCSDRCKTETGL